MELIAHFDPPPRVYQIPDKEDTVLTEEGMAEFSVANTEVDNTATNDKKHVASIKASPSLALGYGGTELSKIIAGCAGEKARAHIFLNLTETYLAMYHKNGRVKSMRMLYKLKAPTLQSIFIVPGVLADTMEKWGIESQTTVASNDANPKNPPNKTKNANFGKQPVTKTHYYSANEPSSERGPTAIAETHEATVDTTLDSNNRTKSNRDKSSETGSKEKHNTPAQLLKKSMSERFPPHTPDGEKVITVTSQTTQHNIRTQGVEDNYDGSKDGKTQDKRHEKHNGFVGSKTVEGLDLGVVLGSGKYSPHNE